MLREGKEKTIQIKAAIKCYNNIMFDIGREEGTIGTNYSQNTSNWNLRDMISEMQYLLDLWNDPDCMAYQDAHDESQPIRNGRKEWLYNWQKEKARMKRFIDTYKPFIGDTICSISHCSIYD